MIEYRPWGYFDVIEETLDYKIKKIVVDIDKRLSLQKHKFRDELWVLICGMALVNLDDKEFKLKQGDSIKILRNNWHRIKNNGIVPLCFIEIQTGNYFGEDDIERCEDDFGRI